MKKPTIEQLSNYPRELDYPAFDAERFFDYYDTIGPDGLAQVKAKA